MTFANSERLRFDRFHETDACALAELLGDPSITRNITSNGSSSEKCMESAHKRIAWHNSHWDQYGYGVLAVRALDPRLAADDQLLGWCGFIPADGDDPDPEILYAIHRDYRGIGLAGEAARYMISHLFDTSSYQGVTAVISTPLNPGSVRVVSKLGMTFRNRMPFSVFISGRELADNVLNYEIWRLENDSNADTDTLIEQVAFRCGQLSTVSSLSEQQILNALSESLLKGYNQACPGDGSDRQLMRLSSKYREGSNDPYMDCYHVSKAQWIAS